jgi:hypothetical protein
MIIVQSRDVMPWNVSVLSAFSEYKVKKSGITLEEAKVRKF